MSILHAQNLVKTYPGRPPVQVLRGVSLSINSGEIVSIVGPSGAGKSTLLHILGSLDSPDEGQLTISGVNPFSLNDKDLSRLRNSKMGFVFQFHQLLPEFSALENVMIPALIAGKSETIASEEAKKCLFRMGLSGREGHKPSELSGGEQQRVSVARSLINNPDIIFADEPSGNLDAANAQSLNELFFSIRKELHKTFVIVTHNEYLAKLSDRRLHMKDGLIVEES